MIAFHNLKRRVCACVYTHIYASFSRERPSHESNQGMTVGQVKRVTCLDRRPLGVGLGRFFLVPVGNGF